jgi:chorismate synthase
VSGLFDDSDHEGLLAGPLLQVAMPDGSAHESASYEVGYTTGEPIAAVVLSTAKKSQHYEQFAGPQGEVRPGHTDLVKFHKSMGYVDYRGGGRSSYRATISDVIGGSIARLYLQEKFGTIILSSIVQVGDLRATRSLADLFTTPTADPATIAAVEETLARSAIPSVDEPFAAEAAELIRRTRIAGDSLGAAVEVVAVNVPALVGEPLYNSLKGRLMGALGGLHAVQACEIGAGTAVVGRTGSGNNDPIRATGYVGNNHGGLLGGITTGMPLVARVSFKPTSSITHAQQSVRKNLEEIEFALEKGRHDPCVGVRAGVTLESRLAIELLNGVLMHQAGRVDGEQFRLF